MTIAKRNQDVSAIGAIRDYQIHIRVNREASKALASLQGLCAAFGHSETLGELFEQVCIPAIKNYCAKYADKARQARREEKHDLV